jgi:multidrug efflux system membrane fusion protein
VPTQEFDQAETAQRDAATSLIEAEKQAAAADQIVGNPKEAEAMVRARQAALAIAKRALSDTEVFAPHGWSDRRIDGYPG